MEYSEYQEKRDAFQVEKESYERKRVGNAIIPHVMWGHPPKSIWEHIGDGISLATHETYYQVGSLIN